MTQTSGAPGGLARLLSIMADLRTPGTGCPWDLEQTFESIAPYTIEEAYEVADAIARRDLVDLKDELGDLLLQVVYHSRIAEEQGAFVFDDVANSVANKMLRRHPHVFGTPEQRAAGAQPDFWARIKVEERAEKANERLARAGSPATAPLPSTGRGREWGVEAGRTREDAKQPLPPTPNPSPLGGGEPNRLEAQSLLSDVPIGLPALTRAVKLQDKAARVGFDWPSLGPVFGKLREELAEFEEVALSGDPRGSALGSDPAGLTPSPTPTSDRNGVRPAGSDPGVANRCKIEEELGDLLFVMANIARHLDIDPETALRGANHKFTRRFAYIEARLAEDGRTPDQSTLEEMDRFWDEVRAKDKADPAG